MKTLSLNKIFIVISVCIIFLFFMLNSYTPLIADDYGYSLGIHSISDIFPSIYGSYYGWNGRMVVLFLGEFWLLAGKPLFNIANTIVYCVFIFLVQFHITGSVKKMSAWLFTVLSIAFWFLVPRRTEIFLWLSGSCAYFWSTVIILLFLIPFRKKQDNPEYKLNVPLSILFFPAAILAGWNAENSGAAVSFLLIAYIIVKIIRKDRFTLFEILGVIGFLIGFSLLIAAPGNYVRAEVVIEEGYGYMNDPILVRYIKRFADITGKFISNHCFLLMAVSVILGFDFIYHKKRKLNVFSYFYALAILASAYSMLLSPILMNRVFFITFVFSVITLGNVLAQMELQLPDIIKRYATISLIVVVITLAYPFFIESKEIVAIYLRWYDRLEYILAEKEKGNMEIEVRYINNSNKDIFFYDFTNEDIWYKTTLEKYFNIITIKTNNEGPLESFWLDKRKRIRQITTSPWGILKKIREIE